MKVNVYKTCILIALMSFFTIALNAQSLPPPPGDPSSSGSNEPVGGDSPIGAGVGFLLLMAGGYGAKKVFDARKKQRGSDV